MGIHTRRHPGALTRHLKPLTVTLNLVQGPFLHRNRRSFGTIDPEPSSG
jgi:hypothetical protein